MNKPIGKYIKTIIGKKSKYPIDIYFDEDTYTFDFWSEPNGIYTRIYNSVLYGENIVKDCLNIKQYELFNMCKEANINFEVDYVQQDPKELIVGALYGFNFADITIVVSIVKIDNNNVYFVKNINGKNDSNEIIWDKNYFINHFDLWGI